MTTLDSRIAHLYTRGQLSTYAIANELKISQGFVARALRRLDIPRRSKSDALTLLSAQRRNLAFERRRP